LFGDVIGLDTVPDTRPLEEILTLTALTIEAILAEDALMKLMADRPTALYIAWLVGQRQRRTDRRLAAISCLDARGRARAAANTVQRKRPIRPPRRGGIDGRR
jgi:hypothetical protein